VIFEHGKKTFTSRHILHQYWYTCPIALAVRRNTQHGSVLTVLSATSAPPCQPLRQQRNVCYPIVKRFSRQTLPTVNTKHSVSLLFGSIPKHGRHFEYWNQTLNMRMRVYYLDCHETELCCYLLRHIENLLRPLQLFYFHLRPTYWIPS
jgi:hypothetical protein